MMALVFTAVILGALACSDLTPPPEVRQSRGIMRDLYATIAYRSHTAPTEVFGKTITITVPTGVTDGMR